MKDFLNRYKGVFVILFLVMFYICGVLHVVSVTSLYDPMGDDKGNLLSYQLVEENGFLDLFVLDVTSTFQKITNVTGRYFPFPTVPLVVLKFISDSIFKYRLYIAIVTFFDIFLLSFLLYRLKHSAWIYTAILGPLVLNIFGYNDGNALYSYFALVQNVFMMMLLSLHFELSSIRTKKVFYYVLTFITALIGCLQYEIGYLVVFPAMIIAWVGYVEQNPNGGNFKIHTYLRNICCVVIPLFCAFLLYTVAHRNVGGEVPIDTQINLSWTRVLMGTIMELNAGMPTRIALNTCGLITKDKIMMQDCLFPVLAAVVFFFAFSMIKFEEKPLRTYFQGLLLAMSLILPSAVLISLTVKFQPDESVWVSWNSGWIVAIMCTFGYMIIVGYFVLGIRQFVDSVYTDNNWLRIIIKALVGAVISAIIIASGVYTHATARITGNNRAYMYNFVGEAFESDLLSSCEDDSVVVSNFNVWGGYDRAEAAFVKVHTGKNLDAYYVDSYWDHGNADEVQEKYVVNVVCGTVERVDAMDKQAQLVMAAKAKDGSLTLSDGMKLYVDLTSFKETEGIKYLVQDEKGKLEKIITCSELKKYSKGNQRFCFEIKDKDILIQEVTITE